MFLLYEALLFLLKVLYLICHLAVVDSEEMAPIFSPVAGVQKEIMNLEMRDIYEVRIPPSSPMLMSPSPTFDGIPPISVDLVRASSQLVVLELELPRTPLVGQPGVVVLSN